MKSDTAKAFDLYAIFGFPLAHTMSPGMQEAAFAASGIKAYYIALEMEPSAFRAAMADLKNSPLEGFNITVPYKETVMPYLGKLLPEAKAIGAVNTVFRSGKKWIGANTDVKGFLTSLSLEGKFNPAGKRTLVFGAGGAARAVVYALASKRAKTVWITNRHPERAIKLAREFGRKFPKTKIRAIAHHGVQLEAALAEAHLVVNATSSGLKPGDKPLVPAGRIPSAKTGKKLFMDLIYHRPETPFLVAAKKAGHKTLGGLGMLLFQGAHAFSLWTGKPAPVSVMRKELRQTLKNKKG